jgi:hypothetical protein
VPGDVDLVCYWFEKARAQMEAGQAQRAVLVAMNSIRGGSNRKVLEWILATPFPLVLIITHIYSSCKFSCDPNDGVGR